MIVPRSKMDKYQNILTFFSADPFVAKVLSNSDALTTFLEDVVLDVILEAMTYDLKTMFDGVTLRRKISIRSFEDNTFLTTTPNTVQ